MRDLRHVRDGVPLKIFLARLIGLCVLPLLVLAIWLAYESVHADVVQLDQEASNLARNLATAIDQHLDARIRALNQLAASPLLDDKTRWGDLYREAQGFRQSFGSHVILADVGDPMHMLFNTRTPFGAPLPLLPRPKGNAAAPSAVATRRPAVGDSFVGPVAKEPLVAVAVPVLRGGEPAFVLLTLFETRQFQRRLDLLALPAGWSVTLLDGRGDVIARRSPPGLDPARDEAADARFTVRSGVSPWSVVLEIPRRVHRASMLKAGLGLGLGVLGATLVAVLGGLRAGKRISRAVASLAQPGLASEQKSEIAEIGFARSQLEVAGSALRESESRFRRLFESAPVPMGHVAHDGTMLALNARFQRVFGYCLEELPTVEDWWTRAYPDAAYRDEVRESWNSAMRGAAAAGTEPPPSERRVIRSDGAERIVQISNIVTPEGVLATFLDVTETRLAEARLKLWAEAFEHAQLGLAIADPRTNEFLAVNPAFAGQHGYAQGELVGLPVMTVFPEDIRAQVREQIVEVDEHGHGVFESEHLSKDGRRFPVLLDITVLRDEAGHPVNRFAYALDLTERKRTEKQLWEAQAAALEHQRRARVAALNQMQDANAARRQAELSLSALRESEERLKLFIEHAPASLAMFDEGMRYLAVSRRWLDDYGLQDQDLTGRSHYEVFPEIGETWKAAHRRGLAGEVIRSDEDRFERQDGRVQWLRWEVRPWYSTEGTVGGVVIFSEDVTDRKRSEQALRLSEEKFAVAFSQNAAAIALTRLENGVFVDVNETWSTLTGYSKAEAIGHSARSMTIWPTAEAASRFVEELKAAGSLRWEQEFLTKSGTPFVTQLSAQLLTVGSERMILSTLVDITGRKRAEEEVRRLNADLEKRVVERTDELTAANQELESFAYAVSHDLRAPLRAMSGFSQALVEDFGGQLQGDATVYLAQIDAASRKMSELIDGILSLSRTTRGELRRDAVDLTEMAERLLAEFGRREPGRRVATAVECGLTARGDARTLEAALSNLLDNAWKYTAKRAGAAIRVYEEERGGRRWFCIADNGAGFDMAHAKRLFQPFQRMHRQDEFSGIGIGLATVQRIIRRHGGEIEATAEPGRGATFRFTLSGAAADPLGVEERTS